MSGSVPARPSPTPRKARGVEAAGRGSGTSPAKNDEAGHELFTHRPAGPADAVEITPSTGEISPGEASSPPRSTPHPSPRPRLNTPMSPTTSVRLADLSSDDKSESDAAPAPAGKRRGRAMVLVGILALLGFAVAAVLVARPQRPVVVSPTAESGQPAATGLALPPPPASGPGVPGPGVPALVPGRPGPDPLGGSSGAPDSVPGAPGAGPNAMPGAGVMPGAGADVPPGAGGIGAPNAGPGAPVRPGAPSAGPGAPARPGAPANAPAAGSRAVKQSAPATGPGHPQPASGNGSARAVRPPTAQRRSVEPAFEPVDPDERRSRDDGDHSRRSGDDREPHRSGATSRTSGRDADLTDGLLDGLLGGVIG